MKLLTGFRGWRKQLQKQAAIIEVQSKLIQEASEFIREIEKGNLQTQVSYELAADKLGDALVSMQKHLLKIAEEEKARTWMNVGLAKFSDILRNKESLNMEELTNNILMNLVKYVNANQGGIFILEDQNKDESHLKMIACYAYNRKKYLNKKVEIGEGLVGQCFLEKETIYITEVPQGYINITSGLGDAAPKAVLISPLLINDKIFGVIELASFEEFQPYKIEFINRLSENIASSIKNVKDNAQTLMLLTASQEQAEELRAQEEEMRQNMEELQTTQEEIVRKSEEIARAAAEAESILNGVNATMATIEFTPQGFVQAANKNFLRTMNYKLEEIKGKHHRQFVPEDIISTEEYQTFWNRLASGEALSGIFKRIDAKGEIVWLNAIYNPIFDANGEVTKVVKFATDITAEQEMNAENQGMLRGINTTMAMIEFTPDGIVRAANENFLKIMKVSMEEIKGVHHKTFVPIEMTESLIYRNFWAKLAEGEAVSGVFERVNSQGESVWLNAVYNPITNASGKVIKVVKFATDITIEKMKEFS